MTKKIVPTIKEEEEYQVLVEELKAIIVEKMFNSRVELLNCKWLLGKKVVEAEKSFERFNYGEKIVEIIAEDLKMSASHLWKCVQFYRKFPFEVFEKALESLAPEKGKAVSWWYVIDKILPKSSQEIEKEENLKELQEKCSHEIFICKKCKKVFESKELFELLKNASILE